jgi:foldase protein PrsA
VKKQHFLLIILILVILNIATISIFVTNPGWFSNNSEEVATIGNESISRQEWLNEMEERYGESILKELIDQKVIEQMAKKYDIKISDKEINREITLLKTNTYGQNQNQNDEQLREQIKNRLLLEETLTKEAVISEKEIKKYYEENKDIFFSPTSYQLSQIIVNTKKEAEQTTKELKQGSSFSVLAMERSIDEFSANEGGNIGFINEEDDRISPEVLQKIKALKPGEWTSPLKTENGYAIYLLHEKIPQKKYSFKEVKNQIRRQQALEQMDTPVSADIFWKEADVDWFYGDKK